jgi:imidazolonepropionase-like amidohydrolase
MQLPVVTAAPALLAAAAIAALAAQPPRAVPAAATLFQGARLIVDARRPPIDDGALLVANGRVAAVGKADGVRAPAGVVRVGLSGKTIMPAMIDAHVHLGYQVGATFAAENYTRETLLDQLNRYQYAGIAAVLSLGTDPPDFGDRIRAEQLAGRLGGALFLYAGRGIAAPNAGPGTPELKAAAYGVTTEDEARRAVRTELARKADVVKIWVDDRNGTVQKLGPALYRAAIDEAHAHGARVVAHVFYLDDAKDLARAGVDAFAHLVRDREVDDELVALMKGRGIVQMPNMAISENGIHAQAPPWFDDPLLHEIVPSAAIERARDAYARRTPDAVARAKTTYDSMERSLAKLNAAGVPIALGTDDGAVRDHFYAFTPHRELQLLVNAGLPRERVLDIATRSTADFLKLADLGTLDVGKRADFVVLDANPLDDIANTRRIHAVYSRGAAVNRAAIVERRREP